MQLLRGEKKSGLTLVEMLVGMALLTLVMGGVYGIMNATQQAARAHQQRALGGRRAWETIRGLCSGLRAIPVVSKREDFRAESRDIPLDEVFEQPGTSVKRAFPSGYVPADRIRFPVLRPAEDRFSRRSGVVEYKYRLGENSWLEGICRRFVEPGEENLKGGWEPFNTHAAGLKFQYLSGDGEWTRQWDRKDLPEAVKMQLWIRISPHGRKAEVEEYRTVVNLPGAEAGVSASLQRE